MGELLAWMVSSEGLAAALWLIGALLLIGLPVEVVLGARILRSLRVKR